MCHEKIEGMLWGNDYIILKISKHLFSKWNGRKFKVSFNLIMAKERCVRKSTGIYIFLTILLVSCSKKEETRDKVLEF